MATGYGPKTTVLDRRIFEREPQANDVDWIGVKKRAVLVARHFAADVRLFEDIHRLQKHGIFHADRRRDVFDLLTAREALEDRIEIVKCVSDLVDRLFLRVLQRSVIVEGILLEEEPDLVAGG